MVKKEELMKKIKEKILLRGQTGVGKTYTAVRLAEFVASRGYKVVYIDPEWGAERELELLDDEVLENIELRIVPEWKSFKYECLKNDTCFLKVVDGLSEGFELALRFLEERYERLGYYVVQDKEIQIRDRDSFVLPYMAYPKVYSGVKEIVHNLVKHSYHIICTAHPFKETATQQALEQAIFRKFDTIIDLEKRESMTPPSIEYVAFLKKHRGKAITSYAMLEDHIGQLKKLFERRM